MGKIPGNRAKTAAPAARKTDVRWSVEVWEALGREAEAWGRSRAAMVKAIVEQQLAFGARVVALKAPGAPGEGSGGAVCRDAGGVPSDDECVDAGSSPIPAPPAAPAPSGRVIVETTATERPVIGHELVDVVAELVLAQFGRRLDNKARARRWIADGLVRVDGRVVRDPEVLVGDKAEVTV